MRKWAIIVPLFLLAIYLGPFIWASQIGEWGPGDEVRAEPGQLVELADGRQLNVHDRGEGPPIVLVHGWASNAADWASVPDLLVARGHRVIAYDRPGYGYSTRERSPEGNFSLASNARDLVQLLDALGIERAALVGWSFGGGVVQRVAIEHPERVSHVALVGSIGPRSTPPEADGQAGLVDRILHSPLAVPFLDWVSHVPPIAFEVTERSVVEAFSGARNVPTGWTIYTQAMLALPGTAHAMAGELQRNEQNPDPARIVQPTLVLHGSDDANVDFAVAEAIHRAAPASALEAVVGGSHMLPVTDGERVADLIHTLVGSTYREGQLPGREGLPPDGAGSASGEPG
jgi:pimeloyl-ACP methyl ester carboxylesterase